MGGKKKISSLYKICKWKKCLPVIFKLYNYYVFEKWFFVAEIVLFMFNCIDRFKNIFYSFFKIRFYYLPIIIFFTILIHTLTIISVHLCVYWFYILICLLHCWKHIYEYKSSRTIMICIISICLGIHIKNHSFLILRGDMLHILVE